MTDPFATASLQRPFEGVLWMVLTGLCFAGVTGIVRHLGTDLPAAQSASIRFAFGVLFLLPVLLPLLRQPLPEGTLSLFLGRGLVHTAAVICWFYAMARLPVAEVTAIGYLNPVLVTLGAVVFFGEKLAWRQVVAVGFGFLGALIVLRPGLREVTGGHLAQLGAATLFAGSYLYASALSKIASAGMVVAMLSLTVTAGLAPLALAVWVPVSLTQVCWLALVAALATGGHYAMTRALSSGPAVGNAAGKLCATGLGDAPRGVGLWRGGRCSCRVWRWHHHRGDQLHHLASGWRAAQASNAHCRDRDIGKRVQEWRRMYW